MFDAPGAPSYDHVQRGCFHWLLLAIAVGTAAAAAAIWTSGEELPAAYVMAAMTVIFGALAACFAHLHVSDAGDALEIRFGPIGLFHRRVSYADITSAATGRSKVIDGWGIHYIPGRGWTWNLRGFDCVELRLRKGRLRIGTDDPDGLAAFLRTRITA